MRRSNSAASAICKSTASRAPEYMDPIHGIYRCGDGRWVRIHANFPHHRNGVFGCSAATTIAPRWHTRWRNGSAAAFETAAAEAGLVATMSRSFAEWDAYPQGRAVAGLPLFSIERIGDAPPRALAGRRSPARRNPRARSHARDRGAGVRPHARGARRRRAAGDGAGTCPRWSRWSSTTGAASSRPPSTCATPDGRATLARLLRRGRRLRAGLPARRDCRTRLRPAGRRAHPPRHRLCLALRLRPRGTMGRAARLRFTGAERQRPQRRRGGGRRRRNAEAAAGAGDRSWHRPSDGLCGDDGARPPCRRRAGAGTCASRLPRPATGCARSDASTACPAPIPVSTMCVTGWRRCDSGFGRITAVRHAAIMSETPTRWARPSVPLGTHPPAWPD